MHDFFCKILKRRLRSCSYLHLVTLEVSVYYIKLILASLGTLIWLELQQHQNIYMSICLRLQKKRYANYKQVSSGINLMGNIIWIYKFTRMLFSLVDVKPK